MHLKLLTEPSILGQIGGRRLALFFKPFADDFRAANLHLPECDPDSANDQYVSSIASILASPAFPERPRQAIELLEYLAAPEHIDRLDAEVTRLQPCLSVHPTDHPIDRALNLWFYDPQAAIDLALACDAVSQSASGDRAADPNGESSETVPVQPAIASTSSPAGADSSQGLEQAHPPVPESCPLIEIKNPNLKAADSLSGRDPDKPRSVGNLPQTPVRFRRLSDPRIVSSMGTYHLHQLFDRFEAPLAARNIPHPLRNGGSDSAEVYAALFSTPEILPPPLVDALIAIEEFAAPNNKQLLEKLAGDANIDDSREPEGWALRLWLRAPFDLQYIKTLQAHIPETFFDNEIEYRDLDENADSSSIGRAEGPGEGKSGLSAGPGSNGSSEFPAFEINPCPRNKIARLPNKIRDSINRLLAQGLSYAEVLQHHAADAPGLNKSNLSRWKRGPHQAWLKNQQRLEESNSQLKFALEAVRQNENNQIHEATQQIAALRISQLFTQLDLSQLKEACIHDPATLARLAHLLPKLSQGGLECERQRLELAQQKPKTPPERPHGPMQRGFTKKALRYFEKKMRLM
jgi:hypothetical protein